MAKLKVSNTALTALKLVGITAMSLDHYNSFVSPQYSRLLFEIGRLALPLFVFVLGYNLARQPAAKMPPIMWRLLLFGLLATPMYNLLGGGLWYWWPLNVLFTLLVGTGTVYLLSLQAPSQLLTPLRLTALLVFTLTASLVDYLWLGPALVVVIWGVFSATDRYARRLLYLTLAVLSLMLCLLNDSLAALLALPVILLVIQCSRGTQLPRLKWFFYGFYPGHLLALLLLNIWINT